MRTGLFRSVALGLIVISMQGRETLAWIYPEHRNIAGAAVAGLKPEEKAALERLWSVARKGYENRLCESPWEGDQGHKPGCIDWAAFPAIAGDHSCSPKELLGSVLDSKWILGVAAVCAELETAIATSKNPVQLRNRLVKSDIELQRVDEEYATRAGASNVHFLLARKSSDVKEYMLESIKSGAEPNAIGVWVRHHAAALRLAAELAKGTIPEPERPALARAILGVEAFALHFLEDSFAAGHVAGCWGDVATRKGTHDYYNEKGMATNTWGGDSVVLLGDARMRKQDQDRAAPVIRESVSQLLAALDPATELHSNALHLPLDRAKVAESFNVCKATTMPDLPPTQGELREPFARVLKSVPVAGLAEGIGSLPRYRAEVGPFLGLASSFRGAFADGALDAENSSSRVTGALDLGIRAGLGLDALLGDMGDGQIFVQVGLTYAAKQRKNCTGDCGTLDSFRALFPQMPARSGISTRLRLPFWLIPGDLIFTAPVLLLVSPKSYEKMAIGAANGGLIPWQTGIDTALGRLQFCLGREVGATFYGYSGGEDQFLVLSETDKLVPIALRSIDVELPIVELRPLRDFATTQRATLVFQIGAGADFPTKITVLPPSTAPEPDLKPSYYGYIKLAFDWRRYL